MFGDAIDVTVLGPGEPELTVVGGIHGDEPSGIRAVRRVIETEPDLERAVRFVVANPPASAVHRRSIDVDMNRVFPGDENASARERRLAAQLADVVEGSTVLSVHATHSSIQPIAFVSGEHPDAQAVASQLPLEHVVNHDPVVDGAFTSCQRVITVEAGRQLTEDATRNATKIVRAFLRLTGALPDDPARGDPAYYTLVEEVEKPAETDDYQLLIDNFRPVEEGETYAKTADVEFVADGSFRPILMSETGYDDIFGYKGQKVGDTLSTARDSWPTPVDAGT